MRSWGHTRTRAAGKARWRLHAGGSACRSRVSGSSAAHSVACSRSRHARTGGRRDKHRAHLRAVGG